MDLIWFPIGYVEEHFCEAYVRASLCAIAAGEEWDKEFWDIPIEKRKECLYGEKSQMLLYKVDSLVGCREEEITFMKQRFGALPTRNTLPNTHG